MPASHTNGLFANPNRYQTSWALSTRNNSLPDALQSDGSLTLHQLIKGSITAHEEKWQSRHNFAPAARKLLNELSKLSIRVAQWINYEWDVKCSEEQSELCFFVPRPSARPPRMGLLKPALVRRNRLRTGGGRYQAFVHKWGLAAASICGCDALYQTASHLILECPLRRRPKRYFGLLITDYKTRCRRSNINVKIEEHLP